MSDSGLVLLTSSLDRVQLWRHLRAHTVMPILLFRYVLVHIRFADLDVLKTRGRGRGLWEGSKQSCRLPGVCSSPVLGAHALRRFSRVQPGSSVHGILPLGIPGSHAPPPGDLPDPGMEPTSPLTPALAGGSFTSSAAWEAPKPWCLVLIPVVRGEDQHLVRNNVRRNRHCEVVRPERKALGQAVRMGAGPELRPLEGTTLE